MNRIIIIGNGFDLAHGLKTSYEDFIEAMMNKSINYNDLVRTELINVGELYSEYQSYTFIKENLNEIIKFKSKYGRINFVNPFFKFLISQCFESNWYDIERYYFNYLVNIKTDGIVSFQYQFELVKKHLELYLNNIVDESKIEKIPEFKSIFLEGNPKSLIFLNFNYTSTLDLYTDDLKDFKIKSTIDIHGKLNSETNPIIFGYGDDYDVRYIDLINKGNNEYMRNLKRQQYNLSDQYEQIRSILNGTEKIEIYSIGHSLGTSDKTLLKEIFENHNVERIKLFYYKNIDGFRYLNDNIRRIVNDETFGKILSYPKSTSIPQNIN